MKRIVAFTAIAAAAILVGEVSGDHAGSGASRIRASYDAATGKLQRLAYDANDDGRFDTWADITNAKVTRVERDTNGDGIADVVDSSPGAAAALIEAARVAGLTAAVIPVRPPAGPDR